MELKDKIFDKMVEEKLFGKNYISIINKLSKLFHTNAKSIVKQLQDLKEEKSIKFTKKTFINCKPLYKGVYFPSNKDFGYVIIDGMTNKFVIEDAKGALNGDIVQVFINNKNVPRATISEIVKRNTQNITGRVIKTQSGSFAFIPDLKEFGEIIAIPQDETSKSAVDHKCIISILNSANNLIKVGKIEKVLGLAGDPIAENVAIASKYGFVKEFPDAVNNEVENIPTCVTEEECMKRLDLRDKNFITVDPATCKDMDDAIYIEETEKGYKIYVAIADVAHYVKLNSEIDKEAFKRGTSDYLGDGVYPMLPEKLSNGICSLNEKVDRLVRVTIIEIDKNGNILKTKLAPAVINSKHKLSYDIADDIHFNKNNADKEYEDIQNQIDMMFKASDILVKVRKDRGALFIESKEPTFILDETKTQVLDVVDHHSELESTKIIESFMILNNEVVGKFFIDNNIFTLFRVHDKPQVSQVIELNNVLTNFNIENVQQDVKSYQRVAEKIKENKYNDYLSMKILRSMQKAVYSPKTIGHFGLASPNYLHFTSPIRRYADLVVHRILKSYEKDKKYLPSFETLEFIGKHISEREKNATLSENESNKLMFVMWAEKHLNEVLDGEIFDFTENGVIVKHNLVEIYIPYTNFGQLSVGGYKLNSTMTCLTNKRTGETYTIGDNLKFKITSASRINRTITATTDLLHVKTINTNKQNDLDKDMTL